MKMNEIMKAIKSLASAQGLYGRILENILELDKQEYQELTEELESQKFENVVDFVMYIEG